MESTEAFIGGMFFIGVATLIVGMFAMNKKIGFFGAWLIGFGVGAIAAFVVGTNVGLLVGIVTSLIAVFTSSTREEYLDKPKETVNTSSSVSVADELKKLNELRIEGIISEKEFQEQKSKLLN